MKASLAWINSYLDRPCPVDEAQRELTAVGFPVEEVEAVTLSDGTTDQQLDVEITSNRGDCLSHLGLARELAAATGRTLQRPEVTLPVAGDRSASELTSVQVEEAEACPVYTARVITGVRVGPSPQWLIDRLTAAGLRSVNNVVDVTNFVLLEMGQPLHAFDMAKLAERRVVVRRAAKGETFTAIDGSAHKLREDMLVIADAQRAVAVAGVMGGRDSEVTQSTVDVLLESAAFDPLAVRRTSRSLKLASDSSYRFERGVDPLGIDRASRRAAAMIVELAGGELAEGVIRVGQDEPRPHEVSMRVGRCNALLGVELAGADQAHALETLELSPRLEGDTVTCTIPTFRGDLHREVDLIEEVARLHGYDRVEVRPKVEMEARRKQPQVAARQLVSQVLTAHGFHETVTFSFLAPRHGEPFLGSDDAVLVEDERRKAEPMLRPSLLPSLLACRKFNQDVGNAGVRLFEAASTWVKRKSDGHILETVRLALLRDADDPAQALREMRGAIEELVQRLGGDGALGRLGIDPQESDLYAAAGNIRLGEQGIGSLGVIAEPIRDRFDVKVPVVAAELALEPLLSLYPPQRGASPLPRFPGIERDLSVVVDEAVAWRQIEYAVAGTKPAMMEELRFLGTYRGKPIAKGSKSVSLRMTFRDPAGTLRHDQVDPQVDAVMSALRESVGAELRT